MKSFIAQLILFFFLCTLTSPSSLVAQQFIQESNSLWDQEDDRFVDDEFDFEEFDSEFERDLDEDETQFGVGEDEFGEGITPGEEDDAYVDEGILPSNTKNLLEIELLKRRLLLEEEKVNAPWNVAYGVGTGLMIGGWFALLFGNTSRDTLRSIGLGIVLGGIVGIIIGTRSVLTPGAPRPDRPLPLPEAAKVTPQPIKQDGLKLAWEMKF